MLCATSPPVSWQSELESASYNKQQTKEQEEKKKKTTNSEGGKPRIWIERLLSVGKIAKSSFLSFFFSLPSSLMSSLSIQTTVKSFIICRHCMTSGKLVTLELTSFVRILLLVVEPELPPGRSVQPAVPSNHLLCTSSYSAYVKRHTHLNTSDNGNHFPPLFPPAGSKGSIRAKCLMKS